jgi:hypothetical protein
MNEKNSNVYNQNVPENIHGFFILKKFLFKCQYISIFLDELYKAFFMRPELRQGDHII